MAGAKTGGGATMQKTSGAGAKADAPVRIGDEAQALDAAGANIGPIFQDAEDAPLPAHGVARVAADLPAPRIAHQLERVPAGGSLKRFKFRGEDVAGLHPVKYVIAPSKTDAEAHYRAACKVPDAARVICTELAD